MARHLRDEMWGVLELDLPRHQIRMDGVDSADLEIEAAASARSERSFRGRKHQADAGAIEERQSGRRLEQEGQSERVTIERDRPFEVGDGEGDLADRAEIAGRGCHVSLRVAWS